MVVMEHLSVLMWIKELYNKDTLTGLEFSFFPIYNEKDVFKKFRKCKIFKILAGFEFMANRSVVNPLNHCTIHFQFWERQYL